MFQHGNVYLFCNFIRTINFAHVIYCKFSTTSRNQAT
jgi:hypothetical protein